MVAGLMVTPPDAGGMPPFWMIYFAVEDADAAAAKVEALGGKVHRAPADIPGTGRFAVVGDPQGAGFGILQPEPMEGQEGAGGAFDQKKAGHGNWNELMSSDPEAGFRFYSDLLGWTKSQAVDMGAMGTYQVFSHDGSDIGGMMGLGNSPVPAWLPYFGANGVDAAIARIEAAGGKAGARADGGAGRRLHRRRPGPAGGVVRGGGAEGGQLTASGRHLSRRRPAAGRAPCDGPPPRARRPRPGAAAISSAVARPMADAAGARLPSTARDHRAEPGNRA